jgi:hypothetical protein
MTVLLPLQGDVFGKTAVAEALGVGLMLVTVSIELQSKVFWRLAVGAFRLF